MKRLFALIFILFAVTGTALAAAPARVALVTRSDSNVQALAPTEIRRLFLGMPVYQNDRRLLPILKTDDRLLYEAFLQKAMYLSATNYETQLVRRVFQYGGTRPLATEDPAQFRQTLLSDTQHIGFMWEADALDDPAVRIVQLLWHRESL